MKFLVGRRPPSPHYSYANGGHLGSPTFLSRIITKQFVFWSFIVSSRKSVRRRSLFLFCFMQALVGLKCAFFCLLRYEREEYRCTMCSYTCTTEKAYLRHLRMHSVGDLKPDGKLSCTVCGKDRVGETALAKHMKKHRDDRYFCCDICIFRTVQLKKVS